MNKTKREHLQNINIYLSNYLSVYISIDLSVLSIYLGYFFNGNILGKKISNFFFMNEANAEKI